MSCYLILDVNNLSSRFFHAIASFGTYELSKSTIAYGLLRDLVFLVDRFIPDRVVFCFDHPINKRDEYFPGYRADRKRKRKNLTKDVQEAYFEFKRQLNEIREVHLPALGFNNILYEEGCEADDMIAAACDEVGEVDNAVLVSSDQDLYQLLTENISIWQPNKSKQFTLKMFKKEYKVEPSQWIEVKAIAGCKSDGIVGVGGVGEKSALKFLRNELREDSKYARLIEYSEDNIAYNRPLVALPFNGTPEVKLVEDNTSANKWRKVLTEIRLTKLIASCPFPAEVE